MLFFDPALQGLFGGGYAGASEILADDAGIEQLIAPARGAGRRDHLGRVRLVAVAAIAAVVLVAVTCNLGRSPSRRSSPLWASPLRVVTVDGRELRVVEVEYASGLRHVDSLGGLDGALFRSTPPVDGKGWGWPAR